MANKGSSLVNRECLAGGDWLVSPNGQYLASMQDDGNFVLYYCTDPAAGMGKDGYWATNTAADERKDGRAGPYVAVLGDDGNFVLYFGSDPVAVTDKEAYWATKTPLGQDQYTLTLQDDGNLLLFRVGDPDQPEEPCWSALPRVVVQCKFMQNYRESSPVNGGKDIVTVRNSAGDLELFTIDSSGNVHTFFTDSTNETGYSEAELTSNLKVTTLAAGIDTQGRTIVLAASSPEPALYYVVGDPKSSVRWSQQAKVENLPVPSGATDIGGIIAQEIAGQLYVSLLFALKQSQSLPTYTIVYTAWQSDAPVFLPMPLPFNTNNLNSVWIGNTAQNASYVVFANADADPSGKILLYTTSNRHLTSGIVQPNLEVVSVDSAVDATGNSQIFAVLKDGHLYQLTGGDPNQSGQPVYLWKLLVQAGATEFPPFEKVVAEPDEHGAIQIFTLSKPASIIENDPAYYKFLYYWTPDPDTGGYAYPPLPIYKSSSMSLAGVGNSSGMVDVFVVDSASKVNHLFLEQESGDWTVQLVETDPANSIIEQYSSYATDITLYDSLGAPLAAVAVKILATEQTRLTINGGTYFIDDHRFINPSTNDSGMLSLAQEADSLASPALQISFPTLQTLPKTPSIVIKPFIDVQNQLAAIQGQQLRDATITNDDGSVSYLLNEQLRSDIQSTNSLAASIQDSFEALVPPEVLSAPGARHHQRYHHRHRFWSRSSAPVSELCKISPHSRQRAWHLSFDGNKITHRVLTAHEAEQLRAETLAAYPLVTTTATGSWWRRIGDALRSVAEGIARVYDVVVHGITATFRLFINGVYYAFEALVTVIEDAFNMVELFFANIKVFFEELYRWLALIFSWGDILRTKDAVVYVLDQILAFAQGAASGIQRQVDNGIANNLEQQLPAMLQEVEDLVGQATAGGYEKSNTQPDPDYETATSNNFLYNEFVINGDSASNILSLPTALGADPFDDFLQQLLSFMNALWESPAWKSLADFFETNLSSPDQIFSVKLRDILVQVGNLLMQALRMGVRTLIDSLLTLLQSAIDTFAQLLKTPWNIPFVSKFYSWVCPGCTLTAGDLLALIVAIPTTLLYKAINKGEAPFPDKASLDDFKASFSSSTMLAGYGFSSAPAASSLPPQIILPDKTLRILAGIYGGSALFGAVFSGMSDARAPQIPSKGWVTFWKYFCIAVSIGARFELFWTPLVTDSMQAAGALNWAYIVAILGCGYGIVLDIYSYTKAKYQALSPATQSDLVTLGAFCFGVVMTVFTDMSVVRGNEPPIKNAWRVLINVPLILQPLRFSPVVLASNYKTNLALGICDVIFGITVAGLGCKALLP